MFSHHQNYSRAMVFNLFHVTCMMSEDNGHGYVHARSWTICSVPGDWIQSRSLLGGVRFWGNTSNIIRRILGWAPKTIYFFSYVYIYIYIYIEIKHIYIYNNIYIYICVCMCIVRLFVLGLFCSHKHFKEKPNTGSKESYQILCISHI